MELLQEFEVWYVIPSIRRELAKFMQKNGLKQVEIAKKLNITKSAVNQYLSGKRGSGIKFSTQFEKKIENAANNINNEMDSVRYIQNLLNLSRKEKIVCQIHQNKEKGFEKCDACFEIPLTETNEIYLDNSATTKVRKEVKEEVNKYLDEIYGNPGSFHQKGLEAKAALEDARKRISKILNCKAEEIIFTGGGTESINLALKGLVKKNKKNHIITSKIEHHAVLDTCEYLEKYENCEITYLNVDRYGMVNLKDVENAIKENTLLVSIMYANNEIGTINHIKEIGEIAKKNNIYFHTDACQAANYCDVDVNNLNVDLMTINSSKMYGPKGVGLLYIRQGIEVVPLIHGGGQENKLRSGTENIPGIMGFAMAFELAQEEKNKEVKRLTMLRDKLIRGILKSIPKTVLNGHPNERLPNNVHISILDIEGEALILYLNEYNIYASTGSACTSKNLDPSHVIIGTGLPHEAAHGSIRFSLGRETTEEAIDKVLEILPEIVKKLRKISPVKFDLEAIKNG